METKVQEHALNGQASLGFYISIVDPSIIEMAKFAGFDFVRIDCEHALFDKAAVANMIRTATNIGMPVYVRVSSLEDITAFLDFGATGIIVPGISCKDDALKAISLAKYAPLGLRGMSTCARSLKYGNITQKDYLRTANERTKLIVQLETKEAMDNIDEILSLDGIDMVATGKNDLAQSFGLIGQANHRMVIDAENRMIEKTLACGKMPTLMGETPTRVAELIGKGVKNITVGYDAKFLMKALTDYVSQFK